MDDCDFAQQLPPDVKADVSPSTFVARPFSTVTHTPHSILPQPRQHVRMRLMSAWAPAPSSATASAAGTMLDDAAATVAVAADSFRNDRLDNDLKPIASPLSNCVVSRPIGAFA